MKKIILAFLILSVFIACKSKTQSSNKDSVSNASATAVTNPLIKEFKPFIDGVWVKTDYIDSLSKNKSPYKSSELLGNVASMIIELPYNNCDSIHIGYSLNNHEGSDFVLYFKTGQLPESLKINLPDYNIKTNFYELGYHVKNNDTTLILYHYNKNKKLLGSTNYTRVLNRQVNNDLGYGINYITNQKLISGSFESIDTSGNHIDVRFTDDGRVYGFGNSKYYFLNTDFEAGPANNIDQIYFDIKPDNVTSQQKIYTYKFVKDTIALYSTKTNADSTLLFADKIVYKLIRKR
jgi:hypothetical protein